MEVQTKVSGDLATVAAIGRLDGHWADELADASPDSRGQARVLLQLGRLISGVRSRRAPARQRDPPLTFATRSGRTNVVDSERDGQHDAVGAPPHVHSVTGDVRDFETRRPGRGEARPDLDLYSRSQL